jgi:hypothetical protein
MYTRQSEWLLLFASESLLDQVDRVWSLLAPPGVTLCRATGGAELRRALAGCRRALIDATDAPDAAREALALGLDRPGRENLAVYTETMHAGLELFARTRGVIVLLGPMSLMEWAGLVQPAPRRPASAAVPSAGRWGRC